jgi:HEXXH motif-containing protein
MRSALLSPSAPAAEPQELSLAPDSARVAALDWSLRDRLVKSLDYIANVVGPEEAPARETLSAVFERIGIAPVSPWLFCLYARLVAEVSRKSAVGAIFNDVVRAASWPAEEGFVGFRNRAVPEAWWEHLEQILDTDRSRPFRAKAPAPAAFSRCRDELRSGLSLLAEADPMQDDELRALLRLIILAEPTGGNPTDRFNGASTFFLWGGALINAGLRRSPIAAIDLLVHESSHVLLFGLAANGALTKDGGERRFASPLRADARPIEGIFHACFVSTRVHIALTRLLDSSALSANDAGEAVDRSRRNGSAARTALETLTHHATPTARGAEILGAIRRYWARTAVD